MVPMAFWPMPWAMAAEHEKPAAVAANKQDEETSEWRRFIATAPAELPPHYRDVIVWELIDGLPHAEIALRLGRREGAAKMLLLRAMTRIATVLGVRRSE